MEKRHRSVLAPFILFALNERQSDQLIE